VATGLSGQTCGTYSGGKVLSAADMAKIGDRTHDPVGANENGVAGIGVLSGDGSRTEFEAENPVLIAKNPTDISAILKK